MILKEFFTLIKFIILLFLFLIIPQSHSLIQMGYETSISPSLVSTRFGNPSQILHLPIDIKAQFTWVTPRRYEYRSSITGKILSEPKEVQINSDRFFGAEYEDTINLGDKDIIALPNFNLLLISEFTQGFGNVKSALGFAFRFPDEKYSLIHQLKKQGQIGHLSFSFVRDPQDKYTTTEGYFFLGGVPREIESIPRTSCKVHGINNHWDCIMNKVSIGNEEFVNYDYSYFDTSLKMIYAPTRFMEFLQKKFLDDALRNSQCQMKDYDMTVKYGCSSQALSQFPQITFYLDDIPYVLKGESMFNCNNNSCDLYIIENKKNNDWIFGTLFLENYHLLFDYDAGQVHFYEVTKSYTSLLYSRKAMLFVLLNIAIASIGVGVLVYAKKKYLRLYIDK